MADKKIQNEVELVSEKSLEDLRQAVAVAYKNLEKITRIIDNIEKEKRKELYKSMPGVSGYFDGFYLVADDGTKYEVPANYAAKSRIVYGDVLKMIDEDGKKVFKQIEKVPRKRIEGVLSKKEGKWYFLSNDGTFKVSDVAAEFHKAELNDKAVAFIPENIAGASFAALDYLEKEKVTEIAGGDDKKKADPSHNAKAEKKIEKKEEPIKRGPLPIRGEKNLTLKKIEHVGKKKTAKKEPKKSEKESTEPEEIKKEYVANILEEDDLR